MHCLVWTWPVESGQDRTTGIRRLGKFSLWKIVYQLWTFVGVFYILLFSVFMEETAPSACTFFYSLSQHFQFNIHRLQHVWDKEQLLYPLCNLKTNFIHKPNFHIVSQAKIWEWLCCTVLDLPVGFPGLMMQRTRGLQCSLAAYRALLSSVMSMAQQLSSFR